MHSKLPQTMPLAGRPVVRYGIEAVRALEPVEVLAVVDHGAESVRAALGSAATCVAQSESPDTAHTVHRTAPAIAGRAATILVLHGDMPLVRPETLRLLLDHHTAQSAAVTVLTAHPSDPVGYGRVLRDMATGRVQVIVQDDEATSGQRIGDEVAGGALCFRDAWFWPNLVRLEKHADGEFYLSDLVAMACTQGELVTALPTTDPLEVLRLDNRLKLAQAEAEMRRRINERWMLAGVSLVHPEVTYIEVDVDIGTDTVIWPHCLLQGQTRIGQGCMIGPGSVIRDSIIGDRCRVELSVVEHASMEEDSNVGPFGHLRSGAHLGAGVHMGNFGEVKNSTLGPGVKMGHFSYLGDAVVGAGTNIGAGTITCNYDGERKHRTVIGQGAFIGSDTMLIAPVVIGDRARTGAGAVVTHDLPAGSVAYGVPARIRSGQEPEGLEVDERDHG